ncbi:MAG: putative zinc-binding protein [Verrucomicrobiae bacterium]
MKKDMNTRKKINLVFVCSGAADVGELTDRAARQLRQEGHGTMSCLASIGARDSDISFNAEIADRVLLIDGCPKACARRTFAEAGLSRFTHFHLNEAGLRKGHSPVTAENIQRVVDHAAKLLAGDIPKP